MTNYIIKQINVQSGSNNLFGFLYLPNNNSNKHPLAVYSHELANTLERGRAYAEYLASNNIACYIFDYAGGSNESKSDGKTTDMSILTELSDLDNVISYFRQEDYIDTDNVFIIGASFGGNVAALYATQKPDSIKSLVLLYPGFVTYFALHDYYESIDNVPSEFSFRGWINVGKKFAKDIWDRNPYDYIGKFTKDVLIIHGDEDKIVPLDYSKRAVNVYPNAKLTVLKGASHHIFFHEYQEHAQALILAFIEKEIGSTNE